MNDQDTAGNTGTDFRPEEVARDLFTVVDRELKGQKAPLIINDGGNRYQVNGLEAGFFQVTPLDQSGGIKPGGIQVLPCNAHYLNLTLPHIQWSGAERAMSAGGTASGK